MKIKGNKQIPKKHHPSNNQEKEPQKGQITHRSKPHALRSSMPSS
jgi:hypothetical protein